MRVVLVRHGQTASNTTRALDTAAPGAPLDAAGLLQAERLAANFVSLVGAAPDAVFVSPLLRARQTAAALEKEFSLPVTVLSGLREIGAGSMEMSSLESDLHCYLDTIFAWINGDLTVEMPGGESGEQVLRRFRQAFKVAFSSVEDLPSRTLVFVAHGALCRFIATTLSAEVKPALVASFPMHNASTTCLEWSGDIPADLNEFFTGSWRALTWSDQLISEYKESDLSLTPVVSKLRG